MLLYFILWSLTVHGRDGRLRGWRMGECWTGGWWTANYQLKITLTDAARSSASVATTGDSKPPPKVTTKNPTSKIFGSYASPTVWVDPKIFTPGCEPPGYRSRWDHRSTRWLPLIWSGQSSRCGLVGAFKGCLVDQCWGKEGKQGKYSEFFVYPPLL